MSKHTGSNIESMNGNLSFGYEALSSEGSIEQIEENQTRYIKKDSVLFVPSHDEGEYTPVILTALPVPADAPDWVAVRRDGDDYVLDLHLFDVAEDGRFCDLGEISSYMKPVVPRAYAMRDYASSDVDAVALYGNAEYWGDLEGLVGDVDSENARLAAEELERRQKENRDKQIRKIGRQVTAIVSVLPLPQPLGMGVNFAAHVFAYTATSLLASD